MSKHTPGPWYVGAQNDGLFIVAGRAPSPDNDYPVHDADRTPLAKVYDEANANILAAAPDLLGALEAIAEGCSFPENDVQRAIRDRARAAIAKAKEGR